VHQRGDAAGVERVEECRVAVLAVKLINNKIKRIKYVVALGGRQTMTIHTTTNNKHPGAMKERRYMRRDQQGARGERYYIVLEAIKLVGDKKLNKIREKLKNIHASVPFNSMCQFFSGRISGVTPEL
jgi:hypothetical protein